MSKKQSLAEQYLKLSESNMSEALPKKLEVALQRLEKKPVAKKADMASHLLTSLIDKVAQTPQGLRILKDFQVGAYDLVVRNDPEELDKPSDDELKDQE